MLTVAALAVTVGLGRFKKIVNTHVYKGDRVDEVAKDTCRYETSRQFSQPSVAAGTHALCIAATGCRGRR